MQGDVTIVGAIIVRVTGAVVIEVVDVSPDMNLLCPPPLFEVPAVDVFVDVVVEVVACVSSVKTLPIRSVGMSIGLYLVPVAQIPVQSFPS